MVQRSSCCKMLAAFASIVFSTNLVTSAKAAVDKGSIRGIVTDAKTGEPLAGVTVTATSPALLGEETAFTDESGRYFLDALPPGEYLVRFYFANLIVDRPKVVLGADQTFAVNVAIETERADTQTYAITVRAPTVDVASPQIQTQINEQLVKNTPIRGRTYDATIAFAPGAARDDVGASFNGATGAENSYLIDGMNTTNPAYGLIGSPLSLEFFRQTNVITGGYNAEYGRAMGGIVNLITKSGSNDAKGSIWFNMQPYSATPDPVARLGEAIATVRNRSDRAIDFGFDLGGPVLKDRLWYYLGFSPSFIFDNYQRSIRTRTAANLPAADNSGNYSGDVDANYQCPSYLKERDPALCTGGGFATQPIPGATSSLTSTSRLFSYIGKLDLRITDDHRASLQYIGSSSTFGGVFNNINKQNSAGNLAGAGFNANPGQMNFGEDVRVHDVLARTTSSFFDGKLEVDVMAGLHDEVDTINPSRDDLGQTTDTRTRSLADFEQVPECREQILHGVTFNPCPVANYLYGGFGFAYEQENRREGLGASATWRTSLLGAHAIKLGGDITHMRYVDRRHYSGGGFFEIYDDGSVVRQSFATANDALNTGRIERGFAGDTSSYAQSLYLRDSYQLGFLPGATINAGVRWELQQMQNQLGETAINLSDNIAPRLGVVYDFTNEGLSKIYASYGRYYESVPLDITDRQFAGEGVTRMVASSCSADASGTVDPATCIFPAPTRGDVYGGTFSLVSPGLRGQYSNEVLGGVDYDIGLGIVVGAAFIHRELGRVIEDISPDGGAHFFIANPGEEPDPSVSADLRGEIAGLETKIAAAGSDVERAALTAQKDAKTTLLNLYEGQSKFPKPTRNYNALMITAQKRWADNFTILASYTYSRTIGNYSGLYQASNQQLDPNVSTSFDLPDLLVNQDGPLPGDRPHNFKMLAAYKIPLGGGEEHGVTIGLAFNALSGSPIEVLGGHPFYGRKGTFILPRGSGGRLPMVTSFDLHAGYARPIGSGYVLELAVDAYNVLDSRTPISVDDEYTVDPVIAIANGGASDLAALKTVDGVQPVLNPNYGQPTAFQSPLALRVGARLTF